ncbi:MAG: anhydro-N-acetylmuramic acid kinase [Ramlibacter sp.]|nr:anhydro-N-acetylmuramic acid kinase [Ramlibacter sp.]
MAELFVGLMSGTSMDGVDGVLADFSGPTPQVLAHAARPFEPGLRERLLALNASGPDELHQAALAANALVRVYAQVVQDLLDAQGLPASAVSAMGAHGQTVRHRPQAFDATGYTIQLNNPALLAELTGIDVVADFRSRDVAAGGQGAPLAPFFHQALLARPGQTTGVLNLGGIANLTLLGPTGSLSGFDCGPANALMDAWCALHTGQPFDRDGAWAASGAVLPGLLKALLAHPYFEQPPPKSTGRDLFNPDWLEAAMKGLGPLSPVDVQATLAELTAQSCAQALRRQGPQASELIVCGGGAFNRHLMARLATLLPGRAVLSSAERGLPPQQVEATAFAWLARKAVRREKLDLQSTTGAQGARVLGAIYPA